MKYMKVKNLDKNISLLELPMPEENFRGVWNTSKYANSKLGKYVEKLICEYVKTRAEEMLEQEV